MKMRAASRPRSCLSNSRVIMGGIEMYNMDHTSDYDSEKIPLDPKGTPLEGYYKPISLPSKKCMYYYIVDSSEVYCPYHGSPSGDIPPSEECKRDEKRKEIEEKRKEFRTSLEKKLYPITIIIILATCIWAIMPSQKKRRTNA